VVEIREDYMLVDGNRVAYTAAGEHGAPVVLVHGGASTRHDWATSIPVLASVHRVYALDLLGYGESDNPEPVYTLRHMSDLLKRFIEEMRLERVHMVGHSLGASAGLEVARLAPEAVARLVLVAPMGFGRVSLIGRALATLAWVWDKGRLMPLPYPPLDIEPDNPNLDSLRAVRAPTCLVWGERDRYFPVSYGKRAMELLPNARLEVFKGHGHAPHREAPAEFNRLVLDFFAADAVQLERRSAT
jgi:pimeloyl-ACP methyl ester carboxylesterase